MLRALDLYEIGSWVCFGISENPHSPRLAPTRYAQSGAEEPGCDQENARCLGRAGMRTPAFRVHRLFVA
jgi:hypothetical protein